MLGTAINELPPFRKDITRLANNELTTDPPSVEDELELNYASFQ